MGLSLSLPGNPILCQHYKSSRNGRDQFKMLTGNSYACYFTRLQLHLQLCNYNQHWDLQVGTCNLHLATGKLALAKQGYKMAWFRNPTRSWEGSMYLQPWKAASVLIEVIG